MTGHLTMWQESDTHTVSQETGDCCGRGECRASVVEGAFRQRRESSNVAYLDRADHAHGSVAQAFDRFSGRLLTTSAVITEAMHLLEASPGGPMSLAEFVQAADIHIAESTQAAELIRAASLMRTYSDTPMDFADATLVLLADQTGVHEMLTLDRRGFSTYRTAKNHRFRLVISEH